MAFLSDFFSGLVSSGNQLLRDSIILSGFLQLIYIVLRIYPSLAELFGAFSEQGSSFDSQCGKPGMSGGPAEDWTLITRVSVAISCWFSRLAGVEFWWSMFYRFNVRKCFFKRKHGKFRRRAQHEKSFWQPRIWWLWRNWTLFLEREAKEKLGTSPTPLFLRGPERCWVGPCGQLHGPGVISAQGSLELCQSRDASYHYSQPRRLAPQRKLAGIIHIIYIYICIYRGYL